MIPWSQVVVRRREQEQILKRAEQNSRLRLVPEVGAKVERWHWRVLQAIGGWLVDAGCRLQTRVEKARQMVRLIESNVAESNSQSIRPCP